MEKLVPISPRSCMEISASRRVTLFNRMMVLAENGMATETSEERVNCGLKGQSPNGGSPGVPGKAYIRLTVRRIMVWERAATESLTRKTIAKGSNDIIPNYVAGGMDATEGAYVWNYTMRNCKAKKLAAQYSSSFVLDMTFLFVYPAFQTFGLWHSSPDVSTGNIGSDNKCSRRPYSGQRLIKFVRRYIYHLLYWQKRREALCRVK
jgi:hypothetical protein